MSDVDRPVASAQPPEEMTRAEVGPPSDAAGGLPSLLATLHYARSQTGLARGALTLARTNQDPGFDCPGCAWPEPARARRDRVLRERREGRPQRGHDAAGPTPSSSRAGRSPSWPPRATTGSTSRGASRTRWCCAPGAEHYEPIDWDDAFALVARELRALASPDEAIFYTSGRTSNEAAFLYQLLARAFGTNNLPDCSNMCHESSGAGLKETIGVGKGTVQLEDFALADAIFVVGQNPGTNHPRMLTTLEAAAKRGATIVSVNPLAEAGTMRFGHPQNPLGAAGRVDAAGAHARAGADQRRRGVLPGRDEGDARGGSDERRVAWSIARSSRSTPGLRGAGRDPRAHAAWAELEASSGVPEETMRAAARGSRSSRERPS